MGFFAKEIKSTAKWSRDKNYRYLLKRVRDKMLPTIVYVLLNPSTGDEKSSDATNVRCQNRAWDMGIGTVIFVNLFAWRATQPKDMMAAKDPVGPYNDKNIVDVCRTATTRKDIIICGWGTLGVFQQRDEVVLSLLESFDLHVLALTKDGHPVHPLYVPYDKKPYLWKSKS